MFPNRVAPKREYRFAPPLLRRPGGRPPGSRAGGDGGGEILPAEEDDSDSDDGAEQAARARARAAERAADRSLAELLSMIPDNPTELTVRARNMNLSAAVCLPPHAT